MKISGSTEPALSIHYQSVLHLAPWLGTKDNCWYATGWRRDLCLHHISIGYAAANKSDERFTNSAAKFSPQGIQFVMFIMFIHPSTPL